MVAVRKIGSKGSSTRFARRRSFFDALSGDDLFKEGQRIVRWPSQWTVVHDFLPRFLPGGMLDEMLGPDQRGFNAVNLKFYRYRNQPFMPVELSAAAYRYGHSQVRAGYMINNTVPPRPRWSARCSARPRGLLLFCRG
jgi:hypothetical protein